MKKRHLVFFAAVTILLAVLLTGCSDDALDLDGKNIVTFVMNEGTLDYKTSRTDTEIYFAYHPGSYILDPAEIPSYQLYRTGYNFTGWYTDKDCKPDSKWDFKTPFDIPELTLYAGWEKAITYSYTVCYTDGANEVVLGTYKVAVGDKFEDWRGFAQERADYTPMGYYSDKALNTPWDAETRHPGGEAEVNDVKVYVKYIPGVWTFVSTYDELRSAINNGNNAYVTADIDCGGGELSFSKVYNGSIEGNGHKISNFTVPKTGTTFYPTCVIFSALGAEASVKNLSFEGAVFELFGISDKKREIIVAALANTSEGASVENVSVSGVLNTDYTGELPRLLEAFYEAPEGGSVVFSADIQVNVVNSENNN